MNTRHKRAVLLLLSVLPVVLATGWYYRHDIVAEARWLALPATEDPPPGALRFAVIGDYGMGTPYTHHVALMVDSWSPDFILTTGDNNYPDESLQSMDENVGQFYAAYITPYQGRFGPGGETNRFFPVPGHRDWDTDSLRPYLDYFTLPGNERYYDFVRGPVHFFMLDTDEREPDGATADSPQGQWLKEGLARSTARWQVVVAHHAPYTSHSVEDIYRMRWPFARWGADAVLSGYYHVYERLEVTRIPYFVNGTGGSWVSHFGAIDPHSRFRYDGSLGAMIVDATEDRLHFRYVDRWGKVIDDFTEREMP